MRRRLLFACLVFTLGAAPIHCGDDATPALEAEKRDLLARTVPKAQFWAAVEGKGRLLKQEKEIAAAADEIAAKAKGLEQELAAADADLAAARSQREQAEAALQQAQGELGRAKAEQQAREARLQGFAQQRAAADPS